MNRHMISCFVNIESYCCEAESKIFLINTLPYLNFPVTQAIPPPMRRRDNRPLF